MTKHLKRLSGSIKRAEPLTTPHIIADHSLSASDSAEDTGIYGGFGWLKDTTFEFRLESNCELKRDCFLESHFHVKPGKEKVGAAAPAVLAGAAARVAKAQKKAEAAPRGFKLCNNKDIPEECTRHVHSRRTAEEASKKYHAFPCPNPHGCGLGCLIIDTKNAPSFSADSKLDENYLPDNFFLQEDLDGYFAEPSANIDDIGIEDLKESSSKSGGQAPIKVEVLAAEDAAPSTPDIAAGVKSLLRGDSKIFFETKYAGFEAKESKLWINPSVRVKHEFSDDRPLFGNFDRVSEPLLAIGSKSTAAHCDKMGFAPSAPTPAEPAVGIEYHQAIAEEVSCDLMLENDLERHLQAGRTEHRVVVAEPTKIEVVHNKSVETEVLDIHSFTLSPEETIQFSSYRYASYSLRLRLFLQAILRQQTVLTPSSYAPKTHYSISWKLFKKLPFVKAVKNSHSLIREVNIDGNENESLHYNGFFIKYLRERKLKSKAPRDEFDVMDMNRLAGFPGCRRINVYIELFAHLSREGQLLTRPAFTSDGKAVGSLRFLINQLAAKWTIAGVEVMKFVDHDIWNNTINHFYALKCVREMENRFSEPNAALELAPFRSGINRDSCRPGLVPFVSLMSGVR